MIGPFRRSRITAPLLRFYTRSLPPLSATERTALEAGTVGFEGELFSGKPKWQQLLDQPKPQLSAEEQAFLDGPCEQVCALIDDWEITHERADLPQNVWDYLKQHKLLGMIITKQSGGLKFWALGHSRLLQKLASFSPTFRLQVPVIDSASR